MKIAKVKYQKWLPNIGKWSDQVFVELVEVDSIEAINREYSGKRLPGNDGCVKIMVDFEMLPIPLINTQQNETR